MKNKENIELKRHIDEWFINWKKKENHKPALIKGIRQSGKTYSIKKFANDNYKKVIYLNFWDQPELISVFNNSLDINNIIKELSVKIVLPNLIEGNTVFIFDEIQECPRALLCLKTNINIKRFDFIASGSYLGINGYVINDKTPKPVGCVDEFDMRTLDFEEFLWAKGYKDQINYIKEAFNNKKPLSISMHETFTKLFKEYICIGGFPEAIKNYISTNNIYASIQITRRITKDLQDDFGRRRGNDNNPIFNTNEVSRIRNAFFLIPSFLGKENKRYIVSKISGKGSKDKGKDAIEYLKDSGIILKVHNLESLSTPLSINIIHNQFKVYPTDIGMLVGMLEDGVANSILSNNLGFAKGMLYEGIIAESLYKRGGDIFYFSKNSGLELDFVINYNSESTILEVKARNGNSKSAKTVMKNKEHYGNVKLIHIKDSNLILNNEILTIPHYMTFLLFNWSDMLVNR